MSDEKKKEPKIILTEDQNTVIDPVSAVLSWDDGFLRKLSICFPAAVLSYDRERHIAKVQPLVKEGWYEDEWKYDLRNPYKVRVRAIQYGGFTLDVPLYAGDTGWVIASDRDTMLLKQEGAFSSAVLEDDRNLEGLVNCYPQKPNSMTLHDLSMGFFIPDNWGVWNMGRWKDNGSIGINGSVYIGQSIGTEDTATIDKKIYEEDAEKAGVSLNKYLEKLQKSLQKGDEYEKGISSSLLIGRHGGLQMLSSSPTDERQSVRITVNNDTVESMVLDKDYEASIISSMDTEYGISLMHVQSMREMFSVEVTDKKVELQCNGMALLIVDGDLTVEATSDIHLNAKGNVTAETQEDAMVSAGNATLIAEKDVSVNAGGSANVISNAEMSLASIGDMKIESGGDMLLSGLGSLVVRGGESVTIDADSLKTEDFDTKTFSVKGPDYGDIVLDSDEVRMYEEKPKLGPRELKVNKNSGVSMTATHKEEASGNSISIFGANMNIVGSSVDMKGKDITINKYFKGKIPKAKEYPYEEERDCDPVIYYNIEKA